MVVLEEDLEAHDEVALGDVVAAVGEGLVVACGDHDGNQGRAQASSAEEVDDRGADAGGVRDERGVGEEGRGGKQVAEAADDVGVGSAARRPLEMADAEADLANSGECTKPRGGLDWGGLRSERLSHQEWPAPHQVITEPQHRVGDAPRQ